MTITNMNNINQNASVDIMSKEEELEQTMKSIQKHLFCALQRNPTSEMILGFIKTYSMALFEGCKDIVREILSVLVGVKNPDEMISHQGDQF
jgi:hypothetical protein